ncbi:TIGR03086 family metal-binding protein [Actinophytocola oryzae]|uniref:Uncharacterized protein (TIGR03086 family) n=1 Tax=Actinophytocola oryzae TaxID=502181 RepID=A0A4R7UZU9_9PSEU|nr:TIGR03086 family metal-binding protein [Actinophytocola oryzae]TDV41727.1 uncharacterized protein (TIGR03086 family) [Actinophytocola oryzae]
MELVKAYDATGTVLAAVTDWDAPSPCAEWTVRDVANHLVGVLKTFAAAVEDGTEVPDGDHLGLDPLGAYRAAADRCLVAFGRPGALTARHPFPFGPTLGSVIAEISLSEALVHGWDIARGASVPYSPAPEVVADVLSRAGSSESPDGAFAPPLPAPPGAPPLTVLLARLGRVA